MNVRPLGITVLVALVIGAGAFGARSSAGTSTSAETGVFKAGAAASNITPPLDEPSWPEPTTGSSPNCGAVTNV